MSNTETGHPRVPVVSAAETHALVRDGAAIYLDVRCARTCSHRVHTARPIACCTCTPCGVAPVPGSRTCAWQSATLWPPLPCASTRHSCTAPPRSLQRAMLPARSTCPSRLGALRDVSCRELAAPGGPMPRNPGSHAPACPACHARPGSPKGAGMPCMARAPRTHAWAPACPSWYVCANGGVTTAPTRARTPSYDHAQPIRMTNWSPTSSL